MRFAWVIAATVIVAATAAAHATSVREKQSDSVWRAEDKCAHDALLQYPDYTVESNAKRDRATRQCETRKGLPPRAPVITSPVRTIPDDEAN